MRDINEYLEVNYKCRYPVYDDLPPTRVHPVLKDEQTLRMFNAMWFESKAEQDNIWRRIDDKMTNYGITSYYEFWRIAVEQGDEDKLPYYFIWQ